MIHTSRTSKLVTMTRASYMMLLVCSKKLNQLTFCIVYPAINRYLKCCFKVWTNLCLAYQESHYRFFCTCIAKRVWKYHRRRCHFFTSQGMKIILTVWNAFFAQISEVFTLPLFVSAPEMTVQRKINFQCTQNEIIVSKQNLAKSSLDKKLWCHVLLSIWAF